MKNAIRSMVAAGVTVAVSLVWVPTVVALDVDDLVGTWNMTYNDGTAAQTGTITVSKNADGTAKIVMATSGGGESEARDIKIEGDSLSYNREISLQGVALTVNYAAKLMDDKLEGSYEVDLGEFAGAAGGQGGPTAWTATKAE